MLLHWKVLSASALSVGAILIARPEPAPTAPQSDITGIELSGCEIDIRPKALLSVARLPLTVVGYEEDVSSNSTIFTLAPAASVGIEVGGPRGEDLQTVVADERNKLVFQYEVVGGAPVFNVTYTKHGETGDETHSYTVNARGEFDPLGELRAPRIEPFGNKPGVANKKRVRVWLHYYGLETAFTLVDA